jgi:cysteine sulfinate desulfinase/cysteine desulfurase-like protein
MSPTLIGFGLTPREADCTLRISFSEYNSETEIAEFAKFLQEGIDTLVRIKR